MPEKCIAMIEELIKLRKAKGFTQKELAKAANLAQPVIARMETGANIPQLSTIIKLLGPLGKTIAIVPLESK